MTDLRAEDPGIHLRPQEASALARDAAELVAENATLRERVKELEGALNLDGLTTRGGLCVECGPLATVDEDGACPMCGATGVGEWLGHFLSTTRAALAAGSKEGA